MDIHVPSWVINNGLWGLLVFSVSVSALLLKSRMDKKRVSSASRRQDDQIISHFIRLVEENTRAFQMLASTMSDHKSITIAVATGLQEAGKALAVMNRDIQRMNDEITEIKNALREGQPNDR